LDLARVEAKAVLDHVTEIADEFCRHVAPDEEDSAMRALLEDVSYNIMKIATLEELK
jgi:hypothetical protein